MQGLAHAVQALELIVLRRAPHAARHVEDGGDRVCVVGGELRIDPVGHAQKAAGIADIADVGRLLAGEDGEALHPLDLRALDLGVPIGALHEADHDLAVKPRGQIIEVFDRKPRPLAISLHDDAKSGPALERRIGKHRLDHIERKRQAICLFGVDVKAHAGGLGEKGEALHAGHQLVHHAVVLGDLITRMQRRELDRDAGVFGDRAMRAIGSDGGDRAGIGKVIGAGVGLGPGRFAEHIVGIGIAARLHLGGPLHRAADVLAQDELAPHLFHRAGHGGTYHRLAQPFDRALQRPREPRAALIKNAARKHQRPCRSVDQRRCGMAEVLAPVRGRDLVFDQRVDRIGIRHPQKRLGQTHERDAFVCRKAVFRKENLHQPRLGRGPDLPHEIGPLGGNPRTILIRQSCLFDQLWQDLVFG